MIESLTPEQQAIIHHPLGQHARVLAVAGSGKTTTMVQRVRHLIVDLKQNPRDIRIVMFNRMAREDFERKLAQAIVSAAQRPRVLTFHALAYSLQNDAVKQGLLKHDLDLWEGAKHDLALINLHRAIDGLLQERVIQDEIDPDEAFQAIGLWKASLIPPERAGHKTNRNLPIVYRRFEEIRTEKQGLTFDDLVPTAFQLINSHPEFRRRWTDRIDHLIVDEYQDINYGQQQLIRLLAGSRADVMIVGDDDQTIYEWRAARPHFILAGFKTDFANKLIADYKLSNSFRFGPLLAQAAHNSIVFNKERAEKPLVAHDVRKTTGVTIVSSPSLEATDLNIAQEIVTLVKQHKVPLKQIAVLARLFVQMEGLQAVLLRFKIPFHVIGMNPFYQRDENMALLDYIRLAMALDSAPNTLTPLHSSRNGTDDDDGTGLFPVRSSDQWRSSGGRGDEAVRALLAIANKPSRKLPRKVLQEAMLAGAREGLTVEQALGLLVQPLTTPFNRGQCKDFCELLDFLRRIQERIRREPQLKAGELLSWIMKNTGYLDYFANYYGAGEGSFERTASVQNFVTYAAATGEGALNFIEHIRTLDTTQGRPKDQVTMMTTIYRTKGLEYDYVFVPACIEGYMPVFGADEQYIYDTEGIVPGNPLSPSLESERRLFYVAITRAVKHVYIGTMADESPAANAKQSTPTLPSRFLEEMQLEPTREIVASLQSTLAAPASPEPCGQPTRMQSKLSTLSCQRALAKRVLENYRKVLDGAAATAIQRLIERSPDVAFRYKRSYRDQSAANAQAATSSSKPVPSDPWADIDIPF